MVRMFAADVESLHRHCGIVSERAHCDCGVYIRGIGNNGLFRPRAGGHDVFHLVDGEWLPCLVVGKSVAVAVGSLDGSSR